MSDMIRQMLAQRKGMAPMPNSSWGPSMLPDQPPSMMDDGAMQPPMIEGVPSVPQGRGGDGPMSGMGRSLFDEPARYSPPMHLLPGPSPERNRILRRPGTHSNET